MEGYGGITIFTYENHKLKSYLYSGAYSFLGGGERKTRTEYTYNIDGTISVVSVDINPTTAAETKRPADVLTLDAKGNIVKITYGDFRSGTTKIEYDTKNNPYKNILGSTLLLYVKEVFYISPYTFYDDVISINNIINEAGIPGITNTNTYDSNNFLTKSVVKSNYEKFSGIYEYTYY